MLHLYEIPLILALVGLAFYVVLGGADFGAGWWQLTAGKGPHAAAIRDHAHAAIAPVWEANHVWLVFVLTVVWTAYPAAFGSIASTLSGFRSGCPRIGVIPRARREKTRSSSPSGQP